MKLSKSRDDMAEQMAWVEDFSANTIRFIGGVEVLGAAGLILPGVTGIAPVLVPLAASGLAATMVLAAIVHFRRNEMPNVAVNVILLLPALFIAWGRFGDYSL